MTRRVPVRRRIAALLVGLTLVTAGCTDEPASEPPPPLTYRQPPKSVCEQIGVQDILRERWRLSPPSEKREPRYDVGTGSTFVSCGFVGTAEDGRYRTNTVFSSDGAVGITVFNSVESAVDDYDGEDKSYRKRVPSIDPGGTVTEISGWWETGISVKLITAVDSGPLGWENPGSTEQRRELLVRHDNLVIRVRIGANAPTSDRAEVGKLLDDIAAVLLDESVKHLPRSTG